MTAKIEVQKTGEGEYEVRVIEGQTQSLHQVRLMPEYHARLAGSKLAPEELIRRSFAFLLEREPKESILGRFDLQVIRRYFPEYEREIRRGL